MRTKFLIAAAAMLTLGLAACGESAEQAGEKMDNSVENATQGHRNTSDGPMEQAGEAVDHATGQERQGNAADAVNDATDGNPNTKP